MSETAPSPFIIRAWFDTVLNPLIYGLEMELRALDAGNLTWRFNSRSLVTLYPVRERLLVEAWPNWEQMSELHPELAPPIEKHDQALARLFDRVTKYYDALVNHPAVAAALKETVPEGEAANIFGQDTPDAGAKVVAEYVVNNVRRVFQYHATAEFWSHHRERFFAIRDLPDVRPLWQETERAAKEFRGSVVELIAALKGFRNRLSLGAGVPIVERLTSEN